MRCHYSLMPADIIHYEHTLLPLLKAAGRQVWITKDAFRQTNCRRGLTRQAKLILDRCERGLPVSLLAALVTPSTRKTHLDL